MGPDLTSLPRTTTCPSCGGALRPEATWCSLCFYDFRSATGVTPAAPAAPAAPAVPFVPAPSPEPVPAAPVYELPAYGHLDDPLTGSLLDLALPPVVPQAPPVVAAVAPVAPPPAVPAPQAPAADPYGYAVTPAPVQQAPAEQAAPKSPSWPCTRCGEDNPLDTMACLTCGSGFLAHAAERPRLELPGVGDLYAMSRGRRAAVAGVAVMVVLLPFMLLVLLTSGGGAPSNAPATSETTIPTVTAP